MSASEENLIEKNINVAAGARCNVFEFAVDIMKKIESGEILSKDYRNKLIVDDAIKQCKTKPFKYNQPSRQAKSQKP